MLCYGGARTQEALQAQWQHVDLARGTIWFPRTKSGQPRTVALHPRVRTALVELWHARGEPTFGHVFLNSRGQPYSDTRDGGGRRCQGGNPLKRAHDNACKRVGIDPRKFTVHGWRHHWASRCVMAGVDLPTLQRLGGWASLRMVERYVTVDVDHMAAAVRKLA